MEQHNTSHLASADWALPETAVARSVSFLHLVVDCLLTTSKTYSYFLPYWGKTHQETKRTIENVWRMRRHLDYSSAATLLYLVIKHQ